MDFPGKRSALVVVIFFGVVYLVFGLVFGEFAGRASTDNMRIVWRLAAWVVSGVAFGLHIWYGHFRLRSSPRSTAVNASLGAAVGAFGLAVAANIHRLSTGTGNRQLLSLALIIWPVMTAIPAFLVARLAVFFIALVRPFEKMDSNS